MRTSLSALTTSLMLLSLVASTAWAQSSERYMLDEEEFRALPTEAQTHYLSGVEALDHIDHATALNDFRSGAEIAVDSTALQFKTADLARRQARFASSRRAQDYLAVALDALQRIIDSPAATPQEQSRAERLRDDLTAEIEQAPYREQQRHELGRDYLFQLSLERDWREAGENTDDMTRAIMTLGGSGSAATRATAILIDETGRLHLPNGAPMNEDGVQMTRDTLPEGAIIDENPDTEIYFGTPSENDSSSSTSALP